MADSQPNPTHEIEALKTELHFIQQRLTAIGQRLDRLSQPVAPRPPVTPPEPAPPILPLPQRPLAPSPQPPVPPPLQPSLPPAPSRESFEVRLGTFWLPRVGMALLLIGMVFLVTWTYRYMGPAGKVALSYACCAALGALGWWLEKRMEQFARVLQAGALALTYFVTYAAHYVATFQVITRPWLALLLLSVVVVAIVAVADRRKSATLAGLALFFGYLTTVISQVAVFTLAANALLAVAALVFLARNRWVTISYGAVFATYLVYALWVWQLNSFGDLQRILFRSAYLGDADFRLRACFLSLYWLLFYGGGLAVHRDALAAGERNGLVTLNNALFFVLFSLLVHHAYPASQWMFQLIFGAVLVVAAGFARRRHRPERELFDTLFVQGLIVTTLGLINRLDGLHLVASLAVETLFLLWLARALAARWIGWLARAVFGFTAAYALTRYATWDGPLIGGVAFAAVMGLIAARLNRPAMLSTLYYAAVAVLLAMSAAGKHYDRATLPWVWPAVAVLVALAGVWLRTREVTWLANAPLLWAHLRYHFGATDIVGQPWTPPQALALLAVTLGFGLAVWGYWRAQAGSEASERASEFLLPYGLATIALLVALPAHSCPARVRLAVWALEAGVLLLAGQRLREPVLRWLAVVPLTWAHGTFLIWRAGQTGYALDQALALVALTLAFGFVLWANALARQRENPHAVLWPFAIAAVLVATLATVDFVPLRWRLAVFAGEGALLALAGVPVLAWLALAPFAVGVGTFVGTKPRRLGTLYDARTNVLLGWLLLVLSARGLRLRHEPRKIRVTLVVLATVVAWFGFQKLAPGNLLSFGWAVAGFLTLTLGFAVRERSYRVAGLVLLAFSLVRVFYHDLAKVETLYRILSFLGLGAILLVLAFLYTKNRERLAKWL